MQKKDDKHFCSCTVFTCPHHPSLHENGCDPCIQKNLRQGEIPSCFYRMISDDLSSIKEYNLESFVNFYLENKAKAK